MVAFHSLIDQGGILNSCLSRLYVEQRSCKPLNGILITLTAREYRSKLAHTIPRSKDTFTPSSLAFSDIDRLKEKELLTFINLQVFRRLGTVCCCTASETYRHKQLFKHLQNDDGNLLPCLSSSICCSGDKRTAFITW